MANVSPASDGITIALRGVHKHYGALRAVDGVDLDIPQGEIFGLIGHNGAGKSTLFKLMLGLEQLSAGSIHIGGAPIGGRGFRALRRQLGYLPENVVLYDNLDGLETLRFFARLKGAPLADCQAMLARVGLEHAGKRPVREYSKGMRQRLGFAQALLGKPRVLFLDEPTNGLDPQAIRDFYAQLQALKATGVTIVITSHILAELQERVDRLAILASGRHSPARHRKHHLGARSRPGPWRCPRTSQGSARRPAGRSTRPIPAPASQSASGFAEAGSGCAGASFGRGSFGSSRRMSSAGVSMSSNWPRLTAQMKAATAMPSRIRLIGMSASKMFMRREPS